MTSGSVEDERAGGGNRFPILGYLAWPVPLPQTLAGLPWKPGVPLWTLGDPRLSPQLLKTRLPGPGGLPRGKRGCWCSPQNWSGPRMEEQRPLGPDPALLSNRLY